MKTIFYSGYGFSGGTVIGSIFKEIEGACILPIEFRLLKERYGICELENSIFESICPEIIDLAIKDYLWLCHNYSYSSGGLGKIGFGYQERTNNTFLDATENYINEISDFNYPMSWHMYDFKMSNLNILLKRVYIKLFKQKKYLVGRKDAYLAYPDKETFINSTKAYLNKIIKAFVHKINTKSFVNDNDLLAVLPKAIPLFSKKHMLQVLNYFEDPKVIIIDRDPRDIFIELIRTKRERYIPKSVDLIDKAKGFIKYYKSIRVDQNEIKNLDSILFLRFEDMCFKYEEKINDIYKFINIDKSIHNKKLTKFKPNISKNNIGLFKDKRYENSNSIKLIEDKLQEYIFES